MEDKYLCGRNISHKCRFQEKNKLIIVANDYSYFEPVSTLSSSLNDVTMLWNLFRRHFCFSEEQIFIYGDLNIDGKMIAWKKRYKIPINLEGKIYFYYSGHGYSDGKLDINKDLENKLNKISISYSIIDSCYSHLYISDTNTFIGATNSDKYLACSTRKVSSFSLNFCKYIIQKENLLDNFKEWIRENKYSFSCEDESMFMKDFFL